MQSANDAPRLHFLSYLVYEILSCMKFYFVGSFFHAARTDFRHHISLTPSRIDLGKMERSMRIVSGNVTAEEVAAAAATSKQPNLVEDPGNSSGEANSSSSSSFAHRLYNKVTKW